jgi:hypothetical protein
VFAGQSSAWAQAWFKVLLHQAVLSRLDVDRGGQVLHEINAWLKKQDRYFYHSPLFDVLHGFRIFGCPVVLAHFHGSLFGHRRPL